MFGKPESVPLITKSDIEAALDRIRPSVHETPLLSATPLGKRMGDVDLIFKCESLQRTGSFKARGALNGMMQLTDAERTRGVVTVSTGNHAQAVAWAAALVGSDCVVVMPDVASPAKIEATRGYGGRVELVSGETIRAFQRAEQLASEGRVMVHPFGDPRVAAGQGTVGLEILEQSPDFDAVVVPIGGGGLISGVAAAIKTTRPHVRIIGVEPEGAPAMRKSLDAGSPQQIAPKTVADGLAAPTVAPLTLEAAKRFVDDVVLVTDDEIRAAMRDVLAYSKLVAEPAAAAGVAGLLSGKIKLATGARVVAILTGGNIDPDRLKTLLQRSSHMHAIERHSFPETAVPKAYGAYSHAVVAGDFVFLSGQIARDPTGEFVGGDVASQTKRAIEIVVDILGRFDLTLADVVRCTVYLADIADFPAMNAVFAEAFAGTFPARSTPQVQMPYGAKVGLEVTAFRGSRRVETHP